MHTRFRNRIDAGKKLAEILERFADADDVVVLALPRGGVPVGYEIARRLRLPLDIIVARKLGIPCHEELAMGAIASGGFGYVDRELIAQLRIPQADVETEIAWEKHEIERREKLLRGDAAPRDVAGETVILVDDGVATGATMRVAVDAVRAARPARIVLAAPAWASVAHARFEHHADDAVGVTFSDAFCSVGQWYEDFSAVSDEDVRILLERSKLALFSRRPGGPKCAKPRPPSSSV